MSTIQDALRKAQKERTARRPGSIPMTPAPSVGLAPPKSRKRRGIWVGAGILLIVSAALAGALSVRRGLFLSSARQGQYSKPLVEQVRTSPPVSPRRPSKPRPSFQSSTQQEDPLFSMDRKAPSPPPQASEKDKEKEQGDGTGSRRGHAPRVSSLPPLQEPMASIRGLMARGDMEEAERSLKSLLDRNPGRTDVMLALANLYLAEKGDMERAYHLYQRVLEQSPRSPEVHVNLGVYYLRSGELSKAREHTRKALELAPEMAVAHYNLACIEAVEGNLADARKALQRAADLDPRCARWALEDPDLRPLRIGAQEAGHLKKGPNFQ